MNAAINIARLVATCGKIEGRKKIQKIIHLLQSCGHDRDFPQQFGYLHYGPYSHEVKADIDLLTDTTTDPNERLVEESSIVCLSHITYEYRPSRKLKEMAISISEALWAPLAIDLNKRSPQDLEAMSTIIFLRRRGGATSDLRSRFEQLKPALVERFDSAMQAVDALPMQNSSAAV